MTDPAVVRCAGSSSPTLHRFHMLPGHQGGSAFAGCISVCCLHCVSRLTDQSGRNDYIYVFRLLQEEFHLGV